MTSLFLSQNTRGLKTLARIDATLDETFVRHGAFAAAFQETWRPDLDEWTDGAGRLFIGVGLHDTDQSRRGSQGVAIALSPPAVQAWQDAKCEKHVNLGARVMAVRLLLQQPNKEAVGVRFACAYAPTSAASADQWTAYYDAIAILLSRKQPNDIFLMGCDQGSLRLRS